jgi:hypothetical protein
MQEKFFRTMVSLGFVEFHLPARTSKEKANLIQQNFCGLQFLFLTRAETTVHQILYEIKLALVEGTKIHRKIGVL